MKTLLATAEPEDRQRQALLARFLRALNRARGLRGFLVTGRPGGGKAMTCDAFYDDEDRGYSCELQPGHNPPHRETQDWHMQDGFGIKYVIEWWSPWGEDRATGKQWAKEDGSS